MHEHGDETHLLFRTVIQVSQLDSHERIDAELRQEIESFKNSQPNNKPQSWACDVYTTIGDPHSIKTPRYDEFS